MTPYPAARHVSAVLVSLAATGMLASCGPAPVVGTPPAAPTGFQVSAATPSSVTLGWVASSGAARYTLERRSGAAPYVQVATPAAAATTYTDTGLNPGTAYTYHLNVTTAAGTSPYTPDVTVTTPDTVAVTDGILGTPERVTVSSPTADRPTLSVSWGDGSPDTSNSQDRSRGVSHDYGASGTYILTVTTTDATGRTATSTRSLDVTRFQTGSQLHVVFDGTGAPRDLSGNGRSGAYAGAGCFGPVADRYGVGGHAERFNDPGVAACTVSVAGGANTQAVPLAGNFTVNVWIRPDSARLGRGGWLVGQQGGAFSLTLGTDGKVTAHVSSPGGGAALSVTDPGAVPGNVWTQYVARLEVTGTPAQSTLRLYRKDSPVDQTTPARVVAEQTAGGSYALAATLPWTVAEAQGGAASGAGDRPFSGEVDDLRLYNRALPEFEISALSRLDRYPKP